MDIIQIGDWRFAVDMQATAEHTTKNAADHCDCAYCRNYYDALDIAHPGVGPFLALFGVNPQGPSELMPFEPTLMLACYRVHGKVLHWGSKPLAEFPVSVELSDKGTFFLWVGELDIPWLQEEAMSEVVSPANLPEFLERMQEVWLLRHEEKCIFS